VPIEVGPLSQLGVLWATRPGGALTSATILLVWLAMSPSVRTGAAGARHALGITMASLCLLGSSAWFEPGPGPAAAIPPFAQHASAAVAPLLALVSLTVLGWACVSAYTLRASGRGAFHVAWILATGAIASEQLARSALGIGPRDAIALGSASSGLVLWLVAGALLHDRLRRRLFGTGGRPERSRGAARLVHAGSACVVASFALHAIAARSNVVLPPGQPVEVMDAFRRPWQLVNQGVSRFDEEGVEVTSLAVEVHSPGGRTTLLTPEIREYHGLDGQHLASGIVHRKSTRGPLQAMRLLFTETDSLEAGRVRVTFLPLPVLWSIGVALLLLGALTGLARRDPPMSEA
jgi:hypothetical protein